MFGWPLLALLLSSVPALGTFLGSFLAPQTGSRCPKTSTDAYGAGPFAYGFGETVHNFPVPYPIRYDLLVSQTAQSCPVNEQLLVYGTLTNTNCAPLAGYRGPRCVL